MSRPTTHDPTVGRLLASRAAAEPDRPLMRTRDGDLTLGQADRDADALCAGLQRLGLEPGQVLPLLVPNRSELVTTWFGAARAGLVTAPVNTALRGTGLVHAINLCRSPVLVVDASLVDTLVDVLPDLLTTTTLVVVGGLPEHDLGLRVVPFDGLKVAGAPLVHAESPPGDPAVLLFTSGSTGRSKACEISHRYLVRHAEVFVDQLGLDREDVLYCPFPLFHIDALALTVMPALLTGAIAAIGERFSVSRFWDEVRDFDATVFDFMGATLTLLHQQPASARDRDHRVRLAWGVPMPSFSAEVEDRFGITLVELYGSTDAGVVLYPADPPVPGSCGRDVGTYDVAVHDADGRPVAAGTVGEIVLRPNEPSLLASSYFDDPAATLATRRDLWFHTGDLGRRDEDGNVFFVGRRGDVVRRRGENIAVSEVEEVIATHPDVVEVAVFGVASELTEQDVMAAVVLRPGTSARPADLWHHCRGRLARHMVPRYLDVVGALPRTPTEKVERHRLASAGVTATTWDAEDAVGR